jgi:hypothetical protein
VTENVVVPVYAGGPGLDMSACAAGRCPRITRGPVYNLESTFQGLVLLPHTRSVSDRREASRASSASTSPSIPRAARERGLEYATVGGLASPSAAQVKDLQPRRTRRLYRVITRCMTRLTDRVYIGGSRRMAGSE